MERTGRAFIMSTTVYPLDTSNLQKGDVIPQSQLIQIVKAAPGTSRYAWGAMRVRDFVVKSLAKRGLEVTVVTKNGNLVILTDAEAGPYNKQFAKTGARRIHRATRRHSRIDLSNLTAEQRIDWDRNQIRLSMVSNALSSAERKSIPAAVPHKRIK